ncbi:MAG: DUF3267 domain-containing protein [Candidatus Baldrarchaeia archaeon]|mgnify:FL=1
MTRHQTCSEGRSVKEYIVEPNLEFSTVLGFLLMAGTYVLIHYVFNTGFRFLKSPLELLKAGLLILAIVPLHEIIHAVVILMRRGRPRVGVKIKYKVLILAVYVASFQPLRRNSAIFMLLTPLLALNFVFLFLLVILSPFRTEIAVLIAANTGASVWDIISSFQLLKFPSSSLILDEGARLRVFVNEKFA